MKNPRFLPYFLLVILTLIWGSSFILMKQGLKVLVPMQLVGVRLGIASIALSPFMLHFFKSVKKEDWKWIIISGIVGNGFPAFLFATAQQKIPSAQAGILNALSPLFVVIMSRVLFGAKFPAGKIIGIVVGLCGAVLILARNGGAFDFGENFQYGLLIVLATIGYGISASIMKYRLSHAPAEMVSSFAISMAGIPALFYLFLGTPFIAVLTEKPGAWLATFYIVILGVMGTGIALILFNRLLKLKDVVFASSVTYLMPLVALSWGLGSGESFGLTQAIGLFLIIAGVYLMSFKRVATLQFSENENQ